MREWTTIDKSGWGPGLWQDEPDKMSWTDETTGLPCLIVRNGRTTGSLCGYVAVPPGHPMHGTSYDDVDVEVHGGLTFADECQPGETEATGICHVPEPGEPHDVWWFGFDCAHAFDLSPAMAVHLAGLGVPRESEGWDVYRDVAYVRSEIEQLAVQLRAMADVPAQ